MAEQKSISAREVIADIKVGMTDEQLMAKHMLSARGLESVKNKLLAAGLITQAQLDGKKGPTAVTPQVDKNLFAKNISDAIKSGIQDNEISSQFGLSPGKLSSVYTALIKAGYITLHDLESRSRNFKEIADRPSDSPATSVKNEEESQQELSHSVLADSLKGGNFKQKAMGLIAKGLEKIETRSTSSSEPVTQKAVPAAVETSLGNIPKKWKYTGEQFMAVCPVCGKKSIQNGIKGKGGISLAKTVTAMATVGISALFTGFSKKTKHFECKACGAVYELTK